MTARGRCLGAAAAGLMVVGLGVIWLAPATAQNTPHRPDVKRGAEIAAQGTANGAAACAQCHPFDGPSVGGGAFQRIDGQSTYYLAQQIADFASGVRDNAIMSPIAKALSPDEIADVAAYYAGINAAFPPAEGAAPALIQRGEQLAKVGSAAKDLQACDNCLGRAASAFRRPSLISPANMPNTSPPNSRCGSAASARTVSKQCP